MPGWLRALARVFQQDLIYPGNFHFEQLIDRDIFQSGSAELFDVLSTHVVNAHFEELIQRKIVEAQPAQLLNVGRSYAMQAQLRELAQRHVVETERLELARIFGRRAGNFELQKVID